MSRLASFGGPSTPSKNPAGPPTKNGGAQSPQAATNRKGKRANSSNVGKLSPAESPSSPRAAKTNQKLSLGHDGDKDSPISTFIESREHRRLRQTLLDIRATTRKWDELVKEDGFRAAKMIIDSRTTIKNSLALVPSGQWPNRAIVGPQMIIISDSMKKIEDMFIKMNHFFERISSLCADLEDLYIASTNQYYTLQAPPAVTSAMDPEAPLYPTSTWSLARFCNCVPRLIPPHYHTLMHSYRLIFDELRQPNIEWERARVLLNAWKDCIPIHQMQTIEIIDGISFERGWSEELEEICSVEIQGWR